MDRYCLVSRTCCQSQKAIENPNDVALNNQKMKTHFYAKSKSQLCLFLYDNELQVLHYAY